MPAGMPQESASGRATAQHAPHADFLHFGAADVW